MLADMLREGGAADPFEPLRIVVQTPGIARWLSLRLADSLGCCMNVRYVSPRNYIDESLCAALGGQKTAAPEQERLLWRIFSMLPDIAEESRDEALGKYIAGGDTFKRLQLAREIASLFDQYLVYRPDLVASWEKGAGDWQAMLWRRLVEKEPMPQLAELLQRFDAARDASPAAQERVFLFALSTLPPAYVEFFRILGKRASVELFAMLPSAEYWGDLPDRKEAAKARAAGLEEDFGQPLLSSLGGQGRDFVNLLVDADCANGREEFGEPDEKSVLGRLQADLLLLNPRHEPREDVPDESLVVANCAGRMRELEALKDYIVSVLDKTPDMDVRDILVLVPDIGSFVAAIKAVFGKSGPGEPELRFHVADSTARDHALAEALLKLMELADSRRGATEIMSLLEQPALAARFELEPDDMALLREMLVKSGFRWGLDAQDRAALGFGNEAANTWLAGMDSLVLGVMMDGRGERVFCNVAPYEESEGERVSLIARASAAFDAVRRSVRDLEVERPLAEWPAVLRAIVARVLPEGDEYTQERKAIAEVIEKLDEMAQYAGADVLGAHCVRSALERMLGDRIAPHGFLSGGITFAELKPMRSVPARLICLLGMDDEAFPRQDKPRSFDLMAREPRAGDRSVRSGDRYLFLETLLCARDKLYLSYSGVSPHGETDKPPAVPVSELLEYLAGQNAGKFITRHPLQPFSAEYFKAEGPLWSYSRANYEAATAAMRLREPRLFCAEPLERVPEGYENPDLNTLCEFLLHPSKFFMAHVMGMRSPAESISAEDEEPLAVDSLQAYGQRARMLDSLLSGKDTRQCIAQAKARGILPWGLAADGAIAAIEKETQDLHRLVQPLFQGEAQGLDSVLHLDVDGGECSLSTHIGPIINGRLVAYRCGRIRVEEQLKSWVQALAISALAESGSEAAAKVTGICYVGKESAIFLRIPATGLEQMTDLLRIYRMGLARPLPVFPKSSYAFAGETPGPRTKKTPLDRAKTAWNNGIFGVENSAECQDPWIRAAFGDFDPMETQQEEFMELSLRIWKGYGEHQESFQP